MLSRGGAKSAPFWRARLGKATICISPGPVGTGDSSRRAGPPVAACSQLSCISGRCGARGASPCQQKLPSPAVFGQSSCSLWEYLLGRQVECWAERGAVPSGQEAMGAPQHAERSQRSLLSRDSFLAWLVLAFPGHAFSRTGNISQLIAELVPRENPSCDQTHPKPHAKAWKSEKGQSSALVGGAAVARAVSLAEACPWLQNALVSLLSSAFSRL